MPPHKPLPMIPACYFDQAVEGRKTYADICKETGVSRHNIIKIGKAVNPEAIAEIARNGRLLAIQKAKRVFHPSVRVGDRKYGPKD
jgi:hypothetical protein